MKHSKKIILAAGLLSLGISTSGLADDTYTLYVTNKTPDTFNLKNGLTTVGTLDVDQKLKKFEFANSDTVLFTSSSVPRLTLKYDPTNQKPNCSDLFQGYSCNFTKAPGTTSYLLTISKSD